MKIQQQSTISRPLHHWDSDDYFGLFRFVGLAIAMLMLATVTTPKVLADEAAQDKSSAEAGRKAQLPLIAGDWKLHSVETEPQVSSLQIDSSTSGQILDGNLVINGETVELEVLKASDFKAEIELTHPSGEPARATIDRLGNVIKVKFHVPTKPKNPEPDSELDSLFHEASQPEPKFVVYEFWKVDPNRSKTVQALRDLQLQVNTLRLEGRQKDMAAVEKKIADLTNTLKRMDVSPQITSLTQQALQSRETGDHDSADKLELEASKLSKQLFAETNAANQREVFVATMGIEPGDLLNKSNSKLVAVDAASVPEGAVTDPAEVWGQFSSTRRSAGDWILSQELQPNKTDAGSNIPPGYRVITIPVDTTTNHSGMLQPGNRIDLLLTFEERDPDSGQRIDHVTPLLENVEVFAVNNNPNANTDSAQMRNISLLVKPEQAMKVQLAREKGSISTALRSSEDTDMMGDITMDESDLLTDDIAQTAEPSSISEDKIDAALAKIVSLHYKSIPLTEILKEIATTHGINIALDSRAMDTKSLKPNTPISIDVDDISLRSALTLLLEQAGGLGFRIENEVLKLSPELYGNREFDRKSLEKQQLKLRSSLDQLEARSIKLAQDYRRLLGEIPREEASRKESDQQLAELETQLKRAVAFAFEAQKTLQDVKLQLAKLDLAEVRAKHERRSGLAQEIIKRRVADLMSGEDLDWPQANSSSANTSPLHKTNASPITGAWYGTVKGTIGQALAGPVFVTITDDQIVIEPDDLRGTIELTDNNSCQISFKLDGSRRLKLAAEFRRDGDKLVINCDSLLARLNLNLQLAPTFAQPSLHDRPAVPLNAEDELPAENSPPIFATPRALVAYFQNAKDKRRSDEYCSVLTEDEVNRSAGIAIAGITQIQTLTNLTEALGGNIDTQSNSPERVATIDILHQLEDLLNRSKCENPSAVATAAHKTICAPTSLWLTPSFYFLSEENSATLRASAGILIDPKDFLEQYLSIIWQAEKTDNEPEADWRITVTGDTARAKDIGSTRETCNLDLVKNLESWQISKLTTAASRLRSQESRTTKDDANQATTAPAVIDLQNTHSSTEE